MLLMLNIFVGYNFKFARNTFFKMYEKLVLNTLQSNMRGWYYWLNIVHFNSASELWRARFTRHVSIRSCQADILKVQLLKLEILEEEFFCLRYFLIHSSWQFDLNDKRMVWLPRQLFERPNQMLRLRFRRVLFTSKYDTLLYVYE